MVSDQELASCVETLLRQAGPTLSAANISVPGLVRHLEAQLGLDLSHKEPFIRSQVAFLLSPPPPPPRPLNPAAAAAAFQQYQYYHQQQQYPGMSAGSGSGYPGQQQQGVSFKYQAAAEMVGAATMATATATTTTATGTVKASAVAVKAKVEPSQENVKAAAGGAAPGTKEGAPAKRKGGPGGLNKVCGVSPELQAIVGQPTMARTEIVKQLWAYIRKNNLQDPNNKRKIICNDELRLVFETDCTDMFKMNKLLSKHIISLSAPSKEKPEAKKLKADPLSGDVVSFDSSGLDKYPIMISDDLAQFFGTGEKKMLRGEALGRVWDHIKSNHLEDPRNAMVILCDSKLKQLFGCESVSALGISELLSRHCFTQS